MRKAAILLSLAPLAATCLPAAADSLPTRKPGLWESAMNPPGGAPAVKVKQCIDNKTDKLAESASVPGGACSKREIRKVAAGYEIDSTCTVSGLTVDAKGLVTGDFVSLVKVDMTTAMKGMPGMPGGLTQKLVIEARRLGECEAGQKPGDVIMPTGQVVRIPGT